MENTKRLTRPAWVRHPPHRLAPVAIRWAIKQLRSLQPVAYTPRVPGQRFVPEVRSGSGLPARNAGTARRSVRHGNKPGPAYRRLRNAVVRAMLSRFR